MSPVRLLFARAALVAASAFGVPVAQADDGVFRIDTNVSGVQTSTSYASVEAAFDALKGSNLRALNPAYTGTQAVQVAIDYRGVSLSASYLAAGASTLVLRIPSIGLTQTFDGGSRDATQTLLKNYFKQDTDDVLARLSKSLASGSPIDPIAGNPNSLMSQQVAQDFRNGFLPPPGSVPGGDASNLGGIGADFGQYRQAGVDSRAYTLPLSYTIRNAEDPRQQLTIRLPITMVDTNGSKTYDAALGVSYRIPLAAYWTLTPALAYGAAGSRDLGSLAGMASASVTSAVTIPFGRFDVSIGDMVGYYKATRVKSGNYGYDPDIQNTVLRNGVVVAQPVDVGGHAMAIEYGLIDTHFFGDDLYVQHTDEVGVSLGTERRASASHGEFRVGANFLYAPKAKGFNVSVAYRF